MTAAPPGDRDRAAGGAEALPRPSPAAGGGDTTDPRRSIGVPPPPHPRGPWQLVLGAALERRRRWYAARARRLPVPVLSVGNLHVGGSGKTPLVAAIARRLRDEGRRVAILSRGYGRSTRGLRYASRGEGPEGTATEVGDEPRMLAEELPDVPIVVGEDRHAAGLDALRALAGRPEVFLLDDGFSHLALARDLELLAFPVQRPWGNGRLLPFGSLRETLRAARAADAVILTGVPGAPAGQGAALADRLRELGFAGPGFAAGLQARVDPEPSARRVVLATGVARPERVLQTACGLGLEVARHLAFADHHAFPARSLARIARAVATSGAAAVAVTAKDHAKLAGRLDVPVVVLRVTAQPEPAFWSWLGERLAALQWRETR